MVDTKLSSYLTNCKYVLQQLSTLDQNIWLNHKPALGRWNNLFKIELVIGFKIGIGVSCFAHSLEICCLPFRTRCFAKSPKQIKTKTKLFKSNLCTFLTTDHSSFISTSSAVNVYYTHWVLWIKLKEVQNNFFKTCFLFLVWRHAD